MAKTSSKVETSTTAQPPVRTKTLPKTETKVKAKLKAKTPRFLRKIGRKCASWKHRIQESRAQHVHLHKSFRRSYREDYLRPTETPGLLSHAMLTFKMIFQHWRVFLPFLILSVIAYILCVGLMSEEFYQQAQAAIDSSAADAGNQIGNFSKAILLLIDTATTGGLESSSESTGLIFAVMLFLVIWLVTIFLLRHFIAGESPKLRDGLYNALSPLIATLVLFVIIFIQLIPIMILVIAYAAALTTNFLAMPFYALLFFIFAVLMLLLSGYLLSSSVMALVAVTAPGIYPMKALFTASDLMAGRRIRMVIRIIYLFFVIAIIYIIVMLPVILLDLWLKSIWTWITSWPIVPLFLLIVMCFCLIYLSTYFYLYYRWLIDHEEKR